MQSISVPLKPFLAPNFVVADMPPRPRQMGLAESPSWPLSEVDVQVLSDMCDAFRVEVFRKAGKADPKCYARPRHG